MTEDTSCYTSGTREDSHYLRVSLMHVDGGTGALSVGQEDEEEEREGVRMHCVRRASGQEERKRVK